MGIEAIVYPCTYPVNDTPHILISYNLQSTNVFYVRLIEIHVKCNIFLQNK